jgi:carbonic anhydrase
MNNQKKWRAEEEERHKGSLTQKKKSKVLEVGCLDKN